MQVIYKSDFNILVRVFDMYKRSIPWELINTLKVRLFTTNRDEYVEYDKSDVNADTHILPVQIQDVATLSNGVLYYEYECSFLTEDTPDQEYNVCDVWQTDIYLRNTPENKKKTSATCVSELVNDAGYVSGLQYNRDLNGKVYGPGISIIIMTETEYQELTAKDSKTLYIAKYMEDDTEKVNLYLGEIKMN